MSNLIPCPHCNREIAVDEIVQSQLSEKIRHSLESELSAERAELAATEKRLVALKLDLNRQKLEVANKVQAELDAERAKILADADARAREQISVELQDKQSEVVALRSRLQKAQAIELGLRKQERELQARAQELQLEVARKLDQERDKIREDAHRQFTQSRELKDAEQQKIIADMRRQIDDLKRKAEQGSVQTQGEVQEVALESMLECTFLSDSIEPVAKGASGADCKQTVFCPNGSICGSILWESKRTKAFKKDWLPKLRDDQRSARASISILVTQAMPKGVDTFVLMNGVWVCSWGCAKGLAMALRAGLIEVGKSKLASQGRVEKMELVYNYLAGQEFVRYVEGIVEAFIEMESDLAKDKRAAKTSWNRRQKQIERMITNTTSLYGDLQGIIGSSMPVVEGLCSPRIEHSGDAQPDAAA